MTSKNLFTTWAYRLDFFRRNHLLEKHVKSSFLWLSRFPDTKCRALWKLWVSPQSDKANNQKRKKSLQTPLSGLQGNTKYKHVQTHIYIYTHFRRMIWYKKETYIYMCVCIHIHIYILYYMYITTYNPNTIFFGSDPGEKHRQVAELRNWHGSFFLFNSKTIDSPIVSGST